MAELTRKTLRGDIPFAQSFRRRFALLRHIPLSRVQALVASVPLDPHIEEFICSRRSECVIVTGNLDLWVRPLLRRLGCRAFASRGGVLAGHLTLLSVLDKAEAVQALRREGKSIVSIGESANDAAMFRESSVAVAFGGVHEPAPAARKLARHYCPDGRSLCETLRLL
jgi:HAD superfamily phosphoserine phosphatase-like hydrolase